MDSQWLINWSYRCNSVEVNNTWSSCKKLPNTSQNRQNLYTMEPCQLWVLINEGIEEITNNETTLGMMIKWHGWYVKKIRIRKDMEFGVIHIAKSQYCLWQNSGGESNKRIHLKNKEGRNYYRIITILPESKDNKSNLFLSEILCGQYPLPTIDWPSTTYRSNGQHFPFIITSHCRCVHKWYLCFRSIRSN